MFQKALQVFKLLKRFDQFLQVFQPPRRFGGFVGLPHLGIAGFVQNLLGQFDMVVWALDHLMPAVDVADKGAQMCCPFAANIALGQHLARAV